MRRLDDALACVCLELALSSRAEEARLAVGRDALLADAGFDATLVVRVPRASCAIQFGAYVQVRIDRIAAPTAHEVFRMRHS